MSRHSLAQVATPAAASARRSPVADRSFRAAAAAAMLAALAPALVHAQDALGTPFIGNHLISFHTAQNTRLDRPAATNTFGVLYGQRFRASASGSHVNLTVRASARPLEGVDSGILDFAATVGLSRQLSALPALSFAASTGVGLMAWADDAAKTGRANFTVPANAGVSYALHIGGATLSPFAMGSMARYDLRNAVNDERTSRETGWDSYYATGATLRLREVALSTSRIAGERGMPSRSRWAFAAGVSF